MKAERECSRKITSENGEKLYEKVISNRKIMIDIHLNKESLREGIITYLDSFECQLYVYE